MDNLRSIFSRYLLQGNNEKAILVVEEAIENNPNEINNYYYLGIVSLLNSETETAQATWMSVLFSSEDTDRDTQSLISILQEIGINLIKNKRLPEAQLIYEQIISFDEDNLNNYCTLAYIYRDSNNLEQAELIFKHLIESNFDNYIVCLDYANILLLQYRYQEIIEILKIAINKFPEEQSLYLAIVKVLKANGEAKQAIFYAEEGLKLNPDNLVFQMANTFILPILYESKIEIQFYNQRFNSCLKHIINNIPLNSKSEKAEALKAISSETNFYLQYQGKNTLNAQIKYGQLVSKIVDLNYPQFSSEENNKNKIDCCVKKIIKIGYISSKMFDNVVGEFFSGWVKYHNSKQFEIYCYSLSRKNDAVTQIYQNYSDKFVQIENNLEIVCDTIKNDRLDILVFLDLGMSPELTKLAGLRLAPIQCQAWGHPVTSGSPMVDYFLTSDLMEHPEGEKHYSEQLVRLPNIAISYSPPQLPSVVKPRSYFNLSDNDTIYWSCQSLFKYLPQYDYLFPAIASQVPTSKLVFIEFPLSDFVNDLFKERLVKAFSKYQLDANDYCLFLSSLPTDDFLNMNLIADVNLDTFAWSGGKTAMEAISCDLPVVTCPGEFMRGRHSFGILKMIEVEETIAYSEQEYIDIAVRLGNDLDWRREIKTKIQNNKHKLYHDRKCIEALENFFKRVVELKVKS